MPQDPMASYHGLYMYVYINTYMNACIHTYIFLLVCVDVLLTTEVFQFSQAEDVEQPFSSEREG